MSTQPSDHSRSLPERPDLRHLKNQAKELYQAGGADSLTDAQWKLAKEYGFASWPRLKAHLESLQEIGRLKSAIDRDDVNVVKEMMIANPELHRAPLGYGNNGPLTWAAECRGVTPTPERLEIIRWMLRHGSDVHQGGDGPLMRAALRDDRIPVMQLLVEHGADVNARWDGHYPIICAPCETLQPGALKWLIQRGADPNVVSTEHGNCVSILIGTYSRRPGAKGECLEVMVDAGHRLPDTAPLAIHRGRVDLLAACVARDPDIVHRGLSEAEIYPFEADYNLGGGLHGAPLAGGSLLHMAIDTRRQKSLNG